ncbi:MAG: anti-phage dCTP deaminase [Planctomycetota bacterium]
MRLPAPEALRSKSAMSGASGISFPVPRGVPVSLFQERPVPLLVFALAGRLGSGASFVGEKIGQQLRTFDYEVEFVDVSTLILVATNKEQGNGHAALKQVQAEFEAAQPSAVARTLALQDRGNQLRDSYGKEILAGLCISEVIAPDLRKKNVIAEGKRQAYIIDSLKHPEEATLLRKVFGDAFYLVGVVATDLRRRERLVQQKKYTEDEFNQLNPRDADEAGVKHGQHAIETVVSSDYLFANDYGTRHQISDEADRLLRLVFGVQVVSPRHDEFGMHVAFKAALRSACLSRQVGAALFSSDHEILGTGHNDVPQFGGGLYSGDDEDQRCWSRGGKCYNDEEKQKLVAELADALITAQLLPAERLHQAVAVLEKTRVKSLIEFSRAVHGEMEAILSVARAATRGLVGATLYATTYPCHSCAKHIIGSGISRVVYLEPYEKSLALRLHSDAFASSPEEAKREKVLVELFGGVAPHRYEDFFTMPERKEKGSFIDKDRERQVLMPVGAQEGELLQLRLERLARAADQRFRPTTT